MMNLSFRDLKNSLNSATSKVKPVVLIRHKHLNYIGGHSKKTTMTTIKNQGNGKHTLNSLIFGSKKLPRLAVGMICRKVTGGKRNMMKISLTLSGIRGWKLVKNPLLSTFAIDFHINNTP